MGWFKKFFDDPVRAFVDPIGQALDASGLSTDATRIGWAPWEIGKMGEYIQKDWASLKHLLVPDLRRDREQMVNSPQTNRRIIYGRCRVSGQMVYAETGGGQKELLHIVVALCTHAVDSLESLYLDDRPIAEFGDKATYEFFDGTQTEACASLVAASAGTWTADHKLLGITYLYLKLTYDEGLFPSGLPTPKAVVKGKKLYDPRTGLTVWSDNPILAIRDYMLLGPEYGGMGCAAAEINDTNLIAQANICDELVVKNAEGTETEKRYTINGVLEIDGTPGQMFSRLLGSCIGSPYYIQGVWFIYVAAYSTPLNFTIDESWLNGGISFNFAEKNSRINTVTGAFINPDDHWGTTGIPTMSVASYVTDDGEELSTDMQLEFCTSGTQAQRMAKITIERSRRGMVVQYPCNFKAYRIAPNDVVPVSNSILGWSSKLFRVLSWEFAGPDGIDLTLVEENEDNYSWVAGDVKAVPLIPLTDLPTPWDVAPPIGLTMAETLYATNVASVVMARVILTWEDSGPTVERYEIEQYGPLDSGFVQVGVTADTTLNIDDASPGNYQFRIRAVNGLGGKSEWSTISGTVIGKTAPPPSPTAFFIGSPPNGVRVFTWSMVSPPLDLAGYRLRYKRAAGGTWDDMFPLHEGLVTATRFETTQVMSGACTFAILAEDTSGNRSAPVYIETTLELPRLAGLYWYEDPFDMGWPGTKTDCDNVGGYLVARGATWEDLPDTWGQFDQWSYNATSPAVYEHEVIDLGLSLPFTPVIEPNVNGTATVTVRTSADNVTWSAYGAPALVTARYFQVKISVAGDLPVIYGSLIYIDTTTVEETIADLDISTLTGDYRIGTGNVRIPIAQDYAMIRRVNVALQNVGAGWSWELIDKDTTTGPEIKIYDGSNTLADCTIDAHVVGH